MQVRERYNLDCTKSGVSQMISDIPSSSADDLLMVDASHHNGITYVPLSPMGKICQVNRNK